MAWIIEDDTMRACAEAWQALVGDRLFGAESTTFRALAPAISWLLNDDPSEPATNCLIGTTSR